MPVKPLNDPHQTLLAASARILRPLVRILLRYGVGYSAFSELAKQVYCEAAQTDFALPGKKQTVSRISTITGLSRKEVARLQAQPEGGGRLDSSGINRAARVIDGWVRDPLFHDGHGEPACLPFEGEARSFSALVKKYSGDITARTIADELARVGAISTDAAGLLRLDTRAYVAGTDDTAKLTILGSDVSALAETIEHNLLHPEQSYFQRKVAYNYIPADAVPELKTQLARQAQGSLESMSETLSRQAVDKQEAVAGRKYLRLGVGIYYFEEEQ